MTEKEFIQIELLRPNLLQKYEQICNDIELLKNGLFKEIGWHYPVDLVWIVISLQRYGIKPGATILDAGAGNGLLQFLLAYYGYNVISVDFSPRQANLITRSFFKINNTRNKKKFQGTYISHLQGLERTKKKFNWVIKKFSNGIMNFRSLGELTKRMHSRKDITGRITLYQADIQKMGEIPENSVDAVVSLSAIEHMEFGAIKQAIVEFNRVLKAGHPIIITTSAAKSDDWYHKPSEGWCFSRKTLASLFERSGSNSITYTDYDEVLSEYKSNQFLRAHMASLYRLSQNTGMPQGIWDPQYLPVGIVTIKK